jgi:predicted dehydrogenase
VLGDPAAATPVALIGCGRWGANVLRDLRALGCEVWVVARSPAGRARAAGGGAAGIVERVSDLPEVAGAVVCTPTSTHFDVVRDAAARRAVPIFVEKPLTADPGEADRLAAELDGRLFVMDKWRYHPAVRELARIARSEELGPVHGLHSRRVTRGHRYDDVDTVVVHAPHDLAIALEILGELPPAAHATAERVGGERVGLLAALGGPPWVTMEVSCVAPDHRRELRLTCRDGVAYLDGGWSEELQILRSLQGEPEPEIRPTPGELPLKAELRAFVEHLHGGPPPRSSATDGALVVRRLAELGALAERVREGVGAA